MSAFNEWLNMLVGGNWADRLAYEKLVANHVTGKRKIDPSQWRGWPRLVFDHRGYRYDGVWTRPSAGSGVF
ncbi:MAG TPA: hypothetical protein VGR84_18760 [Candidatus Acidoferrales bacterium]|nr:hypothetical protein [Candidatus Acidoferrales bacterium]